MRGAELDRTGSPGSPLTVVLGSTNPAKLDATRRVVEVVLPAARVFALAVASSVPDQPRSDAETLRGAEGRAAAAMAAQPADFAVGIESGVAWLEDRLYAFTWAAVLAQDGEIGRGCSARLELPGTVADRVAHGSTLQQALRELYPEATAVRHAGAIGLFTRGAVTRSDATMHALHLAFSRFTFPHPIPRPH